MHRWDIIQSKDVTCFNSLEDWLAFYENQAMNEQWPIHWAKVVFTALHPHPNQRLIVPQLLQKDILWHWVCTSTQNTDPSPQFHQKVAQLKDKAKQQLAQWMTTI